MPDILLVPRDTAVNKRNISHEVYILVEEKSGGKKSKISVLLGSSKFSGEN